MMKPPSFLSGKPCLNDSWIYSRDKRPVHPKPLLIYHVSELDFQCIQTSINQGIYERIPLHSRDRKLHENSLHWYKEVTEVSM